MENIEKWGYSQEESELEFPRNIMAGYRRDITSTDSAFIVFFTRRIPSASP